MDPVPRVMLQVVEIHERSIGKVVVGEVELTHLGSEDGLCACRQRGGAHSQRLVVREVARLLLRRESLTAQMHRKNEIGMLEDLLAIEVKVRGMQEQRVLVRSGASEIPHLVFGKGLGLRSYSKALIVRHKHLISSIAPTGDLFGIYTQCVCHRGMALHRLDCRMQIMLRHEIRVDIVVSDSTILVGSSDSVDAEPVDGIAVAKCTPQSRRLDEQLKADLLFKCVVTSGLHIVDYGVGNVRVDVKCGCACRPVPRTFFTVDGPPGESSTA